MLSVQRLRSSAIRLKKSQLAGHALIYLVSTAVSMALPFLLLPVFTRLLPPSELGPVVVVQGALSFFRTILTLGLRPAVLRSFIADEPNAARRTLGGAILFSFYCTVGGAVAAGGIALLGWRPLVIPSQWLVYVILAAGANAPLQFYLSVLQAEGRAKRFGVIQNSATVLSAVLSVLFLLAFSGDWTSRAAGVLLGPAIAGVAAAGLAASERLLRKPNREVWRDNGALAWATVPHSAVNSFLGFADRLFVAHYATAAVLGLYGVASQLCIVPFAIGLSLNNALQPWWMARLKTTRNLADWKSLRKTGVMISIGVCAFCFVYLFVVYFAIKIALPPNYEKAWHFVPVLFGASLLNIIYFQFVSPIFFYKQTKILSRIGYGNFVFTLAIMFFLADRLGAMGVAIALAASRGFLLLWTVITTDRMVKRELSAS